MARLEYRSSALRRVTWVLWPWMNWLLPVGFVLFCAWRVIDARASMALMIVFASPLLIPIIALLSALPRHALRTGGATVTPREITAPLMLQWWSWAGVALAMPDELIFFPPQQGSVPSALQRLIGDAMSAGFSWWIAIGSLAVAVGSWITCLVFAERPLAVRHPRRWDRLGLASALLAPVLLVAVGGLGIGAGQLQTDAAGERPALAHARTADEQVTLAQERYAEIQDALSALRATMADSGWTAERAELESMHANGPGPAAYRFLIEFSHIAADDLTLDEARLRGALHATGWEISTVGEAPFSIEARRADGTTLTLRSDGDMPFRMTVQTGSWWQSGDQPVTAELTDPGAALGGGYDADRWPQLR